MNKKIIVAIIVLVLLAGGGVWVFASKNNSSDSNSMGNMDMSKSNNSAASSNPVATNAVTVQNFAFSPASITVKKGTTVTWTNQDATPHPVTEDDNTAGAPGLDSKQLAKGETFSGTFNTVGTFTYHCSLHSNMTGTVTVTE